MLLYTKRRSETGEMRVQQDLEYPLEVLLSEAEVDVGAGLRVASNLDSLGQDAGTAEVGL